MSHTLAQNGHCEFVVECILRAQTLQLQLTGMGRRSDPTKYQKATIAIASAE